MEPLSSRHLHRKQLSGVSNGFSAKNAYDDVFSPKLGAPKVPSRVADGDYKEIFGSSRASSIPILDLPAENGKNGSADFRSSKLDYSNIFGGIKDEDASVSYEELVANAGRRRDNKSYSGKIRIPSATESPLQNSDLSKISMENQLLSSEASSQSFDGKKHFSMSYHKSSQGGKDGSNGTTHVVAQFHPEPGFTCFIDETILQNAEADKPKLSVKHDDHSKMGFSEAILEGKNTNNIPDLTKEKTFGMEFRSKSGFSWDGFYSNDKQFNEHDIDLKSHPSEAGPPSSTTANLRRSNKFSKGSMTSNSEASKNNASEHAAEDCLPPFIGEELDANSAAATSAAILKDAIRKAQESIRIAKELMERKKDGLRSVSNHSFKDSLKVKVKRESATVHEGNRIEDRTEDKNAKDTTRSVDSVSQILSGMRRKSNLRSGDVVPDSKESERNSMAEKVISDPHANTLDGVEKCEQATWFSTLVHIGKQRTAISSIKQSHARNEIRLSMDKNDLKEKTMINEIAKPPEVIVDKEKADEKGHKLESECSVDNLESACIEHVKSEKSGISKEDEEIEEKLTCLCIKADCQKKLKGTIQKLEDEMKFEAQELKEIGYDRRLDKAEELKNNGNEQQEVSQQEHDENSTEDLKKKEYEYGHGHDEEVDEDQFEDAFQWVGDEDEPKGTWVTENDEKEEKHKHTREDIETRLEEVHKLKIDEKATKDVYDGKVSEVLFEEIEFDGNEKLVTGCCRIEGNEYPQIKAAKIGGPQEAHFENDEITSGACSCDLSNKICGAQDVPEHEINDNPETSQEVDNNNGSIGVTKNFNDFEVGDTEVNKLVKERENFRTANFVHGIAGDSEASKGVNVIFEVLPSEESAPRFCLTNMSFDKPEVAQRTKDFESDTNLYSGTDFLDDSSIENEDNFDDEIIYHEEAKKDSIESPDEKRHHVEITEVLDKEESVEVDEVKSSQNSEKNEENSHKSSLEEVETKIDEEIKISHSDKVNDGIPNKAYSVEEKETRKVVPNGVEEKEFLKRSDEVNRRERERENERIAVERAIREARERAFAGARERAERAAVEKATAEVRHRVMAEVRVKLEKATAATKSSAERASVEAKLKSERAAVERATAEARERALEKAMSQKTTSRVQKERPVAEKLSGSSTDNAMKKRFSSSDLLRADATNTESAQRSKATIERNERIMERAAKALAEKNMRELLAQNEQAEKNRLAEALDADIKRWSSGKEGNLRALLSTLQYILGPGSGWQPISLTEIVTTDAVKKAYRKATLYVHPDKLQQRGASIQQKYICEKVFDLLKAAWNKFNSEER